MNARTGNPEPQPAEAPDFLADYRPAPVPRRWNGWTAERQRSFLAALAESGCISYAAEEAGITARSAYRLRAHRDGANFAIAWDQALRIAAPKLMTIAYERALRGGYRELWRDGRLISETRAPSDRLLVFLLQHCLAGPGADRRWARLSAMASEASEVITELPLADTGVRADPLSAADYLSQPTLARGRANESDAYGGDTEDDDGDWAD